MKGDELPQNWYWSTLSEVADPNSKAIVSGPFGSNIGSRFFVEHGVPVIRGNNLTTDMRRFVDEGFVFVTEEKADELGNCEALIDDLIFTAAGSLGQVGIIPKTARYPRYIISNKQLRARVDTSRIDPLFAFYWFASKEMVTYIQQRNTGSSVPLINLGVLRSLPLPVPPLPEQRAIAHILGTLDDKIELNRRMNETLEEIARALFKSWFVDFDPVHAKAEGRDPGLPPRLADPFPDSFEESDMGWIPKGWRVESLGDMLTVIETGGRPKGGVKDIVEGVPSVGAESIVGLGHFDYSKTKFVPRDFFDSMRKGHVDDGDVLLYKDGGRPGEYEPHLTMVGNDFPFAEFCINEHVYRLRTEPILPQSYLYFWLSSDAAMDEMRVRGTGVAIPGLNSIAVKQIAILKPSPEVLELFAQTIAPIVNSIFRNCNEARSLAILRDALLPKLISGEMRIEDAERFIGGQV